MGKEIEVDILLKDLDENDMGSIIRTYDELNQVSEIIKEKINMLSDKLKNGLKERKWESFKDDKSNISISISTEQTESLNKKALRMLLNDEQYNQVVTKNSFKKLLIITPKDRERLKNYGKK